MNNASVQEDVELESLIARVADEFRVSQERGDRPQIEEYAARYPQAADLLRKVLGALELIDLSLPGTASEASRVASAPGGEAVSGTLGDFRILREVGRGGMGVVYEAEQISLGRRVALKVLPFAGALDAKQLQRFKNEAHAAAHLQHQNIVPVYFVGCERGVHFYAMQFVEGQTLAALIQELRQSLSGGRQPPERAEERGSKIEDRGSAGRFDPLLTGPYTPENRVARHESSKGVQRKITDQPTPFQDSGRVTQESATLEDRGALIETVSTPPRSSILDSRSSPFFRTVANLGIQAAEALEHAHQLGVIHRDIKPANLIIEPLSPTGERGRGERAEVTAGVGLWITDFGLAHCQGGCELTMSGDLLGTLRYMSPEQAMGKRVIVDQRTDIYSLGASLYELLTLEPVFSGHDRQELLRQIAFEDPKPPRRLNKAIPPELETIVLKAVEKNFADRYATAQELADDLQRFLDDKAIRAKRPSLVQKARRWGRRHKPAVWAAAVSIVVLFIMTVLGLLISNFRIAQEQTLTKNALDQAKEQRDEAEANFRKACQAVDDQFTLVSQSKLFEAPGLQSLRKDLLESALKYYQLFLRQRPEDPVLQIEVAAAYLRLYQIYQATDGGLSPKAIGTLEKGLAIAEKMLPEQGDDAELSRRLAGFAKSGRFVHGVTGPRAEPTVGLPVFERAIRIWENFVRNNPTELGFQFDLSEFYVFAHYFQIDAGRPAEALASLHKSHDISEKLARENPKVPEYRAQLAFAHKHLGERLAKDGPPEQIEKHCRRYFELSQELAAECPKVPEYRGMLADGHHHLGGWFSASGRLPEAEQASRQALILWEMLVTEFPSFPSYRGELASSYDSLGHLLRHTGRAEKAEEAYRQALTIWQRLADDFPALPDYGGSLAFSSFNQCLMLAAIGRTQEAEQVYRKVLNFNPEDPPAQNDLAWLLANCPDSKFRDPSRAIKLAKKAVELSPKEANFWNTLGAAQYRAGHCKDAVAALEESMELGRGGDSFDWFFLAMAHWELGDKEQARQWYDKALSGMEKNQPRNEGNRQELRRFRAEAAQVLGIQEQPTEKETGKPQAKAPSP